MSEWQRTTLAGAGAVVLDCEHKTPVAQDSGIPYLAIPNVQEGALDLSDVRLISEDDYKEWTRRTIPRAGDILLTRRGRVGDTAPIPTGLRCAIGQNLVLIRSISSNLDQSYLRWALTGPAYDRQVYKYLNVGAIFDSLNVKDIPKFEIFLPPLPIQRQIAAILSAFDDKIELNRQMNRTLEQMARALFKSWFVDFDPVRAKMSGEMPEGMDAETAALFPDELVEVEGREVPVGWEIERAEKFSNISIGKTPPRKETEWFSENKSDRVWISIRDMGSPGIYISESAEYLTQEGVDNFNVKVAPAGTVLLSFKLTIGRLKITKTASTTNEAIAHFIPKFGRKAVNYTYFYLDSFDFSVLGSTSSIATAVNSKIIKDMPFLVPTLKVIELFDTRIGSVMDRIALTESESAQLAHLRDALLPRLLSGEVDVGGWEAALEQPLEGQA